MSTLTLVLTVTGMLVTLFSAPSTAERAPVVSMLELRQASVVRQQWGLSCGAAALATLLRYQHGINITEKSVALGLIDNPEYLNDPSRLHRQQGFSLLDLKNFVDSIGLLGNGLGKLSLGDIADLAPVIIPVNLDGYNHFVVFRGLASNRVLLADPGWGNRVLSVEEFESSWISYPKLGKVGFSVSSDNPTHLTLLKPKAMDFVMLK